MIIVCGLQAIVGFTMDGKMHHPQFDFDSEEVRYNHRFAPFGNLITPPPVTYAQYKVNKLNWMQFHFVPCYYDLIIQPSLYQIGRTPSLDVTYVFIVVTHLSLQASGLKQPLV